MITNLSDKLKRVKDRIHSLKSSREQAGAL